jgi:competence protein ComEC
MKHRAIPLLLVTFLLLLAGTARAQKTEGMAAHFINVGQAESILLEFKTAAVLIDAGGEDTGNRRDLNRLVGYLDRFFDDRPHLKRTLHSVIISHPHIDHTRNIMALFYKKNKFKVLNLVDGGHRGDSIGLGPLNRARAAVKAKNILYNVIEDKEIGQQGYTTPHLGKLLTSGSEVDVRFLAGSRGCENENNDSLVVRVEYKEAAFLFVGDAETHNDDICTAEVAELVDFYQGTGLLDVDLYKVGHHCSHNGTSDALMRAMTPEISVISAGDLKTRTPGDFHAFNFGHPREEAFLRLLEFTTGKRPQKNVYAMNAAGVPPPKSKKPPGKPIFRDITEAVFCTCWDGNVVVSTDAAGRLQPPETSGL